MSRPVILAVLAIVSLFLLPPVLQGQEAESGSDSASPGIDPDTLEELIETIRETETELHRIRQSIPGTEGEDRALLRSQLYDLARGQRENLIQLIDQTSRYEKSGGDVALFKQQLEQFLRRASRRVRSYIEFVEGDLGEEAQKREALSPSELQVYEHDMAERTARLTEAYSGLLDLSQRMAAIGLDTEDEEAFLEQSLNERGDTLYRVLELTGNQIAQYRELAKNSPDDAEIQARLFAAEERYHSNKTALLATIHLMKSAGLEHTELKVRALELTGEVTPEDLELDVVVGLVQRWLTRLRSYLSDNGVRLLIRLLVIVGILLLFWILAGLTRRVMGRALDRTKVASSKLLKEMTVAMAGRIVLVVGLIIILHQMGISLGPILAGLGIAGFIVGFALQDTLANFAAGAMILAYRPYDVGDFVEAAGISGKVRDMNLVSTRILTFDHQTLIVPNSKIWGDVIRNVTAQPMRRVDMVFGISYEDDIDQAEALLRDIVEGHERVLDDPEPVIKVHTLNDSSVDFIVRPWVKTDDYWDVYWDLTKEVKLRFDREGISIPYPQRDVHLFAQKDKPEPSTDGQA